MDPVEPAERSRFVQWFRSVAPYVNAFRGRTFVVGFGGEVVADGKFVELTHDLNLLASLGIRLVLVHGARPQIEARMQERGVTDRYVQGLRVTDELAMECVKESVGRLRLEIEALLSMGLPNSPMANAEIRVASGNFVVARPVGVLDGIDLMHTGKVRKLDVAAIARRLDQGDVVLLGPLGYSPSGEVFNLTMEDVATSCAIALAADKLVLLGEDDGLQGDDGALLRELTTEDAELLLHREKSESTDWKSLLASAARAGRGGVGRVHLVNRRTDGALLLELFTHGGIGTMVSQAPLQDVRSALVDDIGAILSLIEPLEADGSLVRRGRDLLEREVTRFTVVEHDRLLVGCAALYPFPEDAAGELACLAVRPEYRNSGHGDLLLRAIEAQARAAGLKRLFTLTTRAAHWFLERGFSEAGLDALPAQKQSLYNLQRRSKVFQKAL